MSRPPKPAHLKAIDGTTRKDRGAPEDTIRYPALEVVPPPPDWLVNAHARQEFLRLAPILSQNKLLTEVNLSALANLCAIHGVMVTAWAAGGFPPAAIIAQFRQLCSEFGITPMSQGRIKAPGAAPEQNKFSSNGRPRAA